MMRVPRDVSGALSSSCGVGNGRVDGRGQAIPHDRAAMRTEEAVLDVNTQAVLEDLKRLAAS